MGLLGCQVNLASIFFHKKTLYIGIKNVIMCSIKSANQNKLLTENKNPNSLAFNLAHPPPSMDDPQAMLGLAWNLVGW